MTKLFLTEFEKPGDRRIPCWFLRQAGRYLPEYQELRRTTRNFLEFCYTPEMTVEAALQPLRRYDLDAAIVFSDILVIPDALGHSVQFKEGHGPVLEPVRSAKDLDPSRLDGVVDHLQPVMESISTLRTRLPPDKALIGFAGAPWTIAIYMVEGRGGTGCENACLWAYEDPGGFKTLIDLITEATIRYLRAQVDAGADVIQLFDSWAGQLSAGEAEKWSIAPTARIVSALKAHAPHVPIIGFPRLAGAWLEHYVAETKVDGVSLDPTVPISVISEALSKRCLVQGNLDPLLLRVGGDALRRAVEKIVEGLTSHRFIFNLGHGIPPTASPDNVKMVIDTVRRWERYSQSWGD